MSASHEIRCELEGLVAVARGSGRSKDILIFNSDLPDYPIAADYGNPTSAAVRERLEARMSSVERIKCEILLRQLANRVSITDSAIESTKQKSNEELVDAGSAAWDSAVATAELLEEIRTFINRYVALPEDADVAIALWLMHTYVPEASDYTPYLLITSPVRECGKSTLLDLLASLASRPQLTGGITAAALYRRIDRTAPTILLDELDTRLRGDGGENLRAVLNTGFHRNGKITLCVGDAHEDRDFRTFCPKALAGIGQPWDTVVSRSIPIRLSRASSAQLKALTKIRGDRLYADCEYLRRKLTRWAADEVEILKGSDPHVPESLGARQADVWLVVNTRVLRRSICTKSEATKPTSRL
jgi:hypothetical protein